MTVLVVTPPAALVAAADAKTMAPVLDADTNERVTLLLSIAQAGIERGWIGRAFGGQVLDLVLDGWPCGGASVPLPFPPVTSVTSVSYRDADGETQILPEFAWRLVRGRSASPALWCALTTGWPATDGAPEAVTIRYAAGYAADDPEVLPARQAIVLAAVALRGFATQDLAISSESVDGVGETRWTVSDAAGRVIAGAVDALLGGYRVFR